MTDFAITDVVQTYHAASWPVLNDPAVWQEERERRTDQLLPWPIPEKGTKFQRAIALLANADISVVMGLLLTKGDALAPALPPDVGDWRMQVLLRVVARSMEAGRNAVSKEIGTELPTGWREFRKMVAEQWDAEARSMARPGLSLRKVTKLYELPRSSTYRAAKRRR